MSESLLKSRSPLQTWHTLWKQSFLSFPESALLLWCFVPPHFSHRSGFSISLCTQTPLEVDLIDANSSERVRRPGIMVWVQPTQRVQVDPQHLIFRVSLKWSISCGGSWFWIITIYIYIVLYIHNTYITHEIYTVYIDFREFFCLGNTMDLYMETRPSIWPTSPGTSWGWPGGAVLTSRGAQGQAMIQCWLMISSGLY